ncbi:MAG: hypothetical protein HQL90_00995 [Magnetococcales bacterium]|nr:hypothetical protein [Magnetococcales bacterium]
MTQTDDPGSWRRFFRYALLWIVTVSAGGEPVAAPSTAQPAYSTSAHLLYPDRDLKPAASRLTGADWLKIIRERIPPLTHERGKRWPLIFIAGVGFEPLSVAEIRMLLERGITQHLELKSSAIAAARRLKEAGAPVILFDGRNGAWPYNLEKDKSQWAHQYPDALKVDEHWRDLPSPALFRGWAVAADQLRATLNRFRQEQIPVDAIWLDYENEPSMANYFATILSPNSRALLPESALANEKAFRLYCRQLWVQLLSTYVAGPAREIFPRLSITNWVVTLSSVEQPVLDWTNEPHPPMGPTLFTATNPIAYGIDTAFLALWQKEFVLDQEHVDQFYTHILLRQISADSSNRQQQAPYMASIPWVGRWVADHPGKKVPIMSRERYREVLRHLWLRGIDGMQVFNPIHAQDRVGMAIAEVEDTTAVYNEMLGYREFLEKGTPINLNYPAIQSEGALWSGLRYQDEAIVRVFWQGTAIGLLEIEPWPGSKVTLSNPLRGATYRLHREKKDDTIQIVSVNR